MLLTAITAVAFFVGSAELEQLEKFYWDCDTAFMKGELGPNSLFGCLEVTEQFKIMGFENDREQFMEYWREHNLQEWNKRGYQPEKNERGT